MSVPADPEFLLAAACCRWPPSAIRDAALQAAAATIDWPRFARVVRRQRIGGLVDAALKAARIVPPEPIETIIAQDARRIARRNLLAASETARLVRLIAAAGYRILAVKGAVLGAQAYGSIAMKHSKDIDLLVLPAQGGAVLALLEADGYRLTAPAEQLSLAQRATLTRYGKDVTLLHPVHGTQVELHWRLFGNATLLPKVTARSPSVTVTLSHGVTAPTLGLTDLYAYLVLHGAQDGWSRVKWLADVNALIAPLDDAAVQALHRHAVGRGAGLASAQALLLMEALFDRPLPAPFAQTLRQSRRVRLLVAGAYRLMAVADGMTEVADCRAAQRAMLAMQLLLGRGPRYYWHALRGVLYLRQDMYGSRVPPALYALYPAIRAPRWALREIRGAMS